jgi:hypothetical protein
MTFKHNIMTIMNKQELSNTENNDFVFRTELPGSLSKNLKQVFLIETLKIRTKNSNPDSTKIRIQQQRVLK